MQGLIILLLPLTITAKQYLVETKNSMEPPTLVLRSFFYYVNLQSLVKKGDPIRLLYPKVTNRSVLPYLGQVFKIVQISWKGL